MKCLYCDCTESKVVDSRSADDDRTIRRRRECTGCGRRFTTYETIEVTPVLVVKNNGTRQSFNAEKIRNGIIKSCEKRPVPMSVIDDIVSDISKQVYNSMEYEITTKEIGEMVMERLKKVDEVSYVRYASVYRSFKDLSSFMAELKQMMKAEKAERKAAEKVLTDKAEKNTEGSDK
ncbi:MAG: transcriptional repressor NrdR [Clostridia bacterium]|nr:transcriptional repressor NrdR [Clostridia bacterium]